MRRLLLLVPVGSLLTALLALATYHYHSAPSAGSRVPHALSAAPSAQDRPLPPAEAATHMTVPDGFHVTLFAGEPDLVQPIAMAFDDRGRLWVAECLSYPNWLPPGRHGPDRILI